MRFGEPLLEFSHTLTALCVEIALLCLMHELVMVTNEPHTEYALIAKCMAKEDS
jgi:hypothetical protein